MEELFKVFIAAPPLLSTFSYRNYKGFKFYIFKLNKD